MNIKKVPVEYCFINMVRDPSNCVIENTIEFASEE